LALERRGAIAGREERGKKKREKEVSEKRGPRIAVV